MHFDYNDYLLGLGGEILTAVNEEQDSGVLIDVLMEFIRLGLRV